MLRTFEKALFLTHFSETQDLRNVFGVDDALLYSSVLSKEAAVSGISFSRNIYCTSKFSVREGFPVNPKKQRFWQRRQDEVARWPPSKSWKSPPVLDLSKGYSEHLTSILITLKGVPDSEVNNVLDPWKGKLHAREQSVLLDKATPWSKALAIFSWLQCQEDYVLNVFHYNIMVKVLGRAQKLELMEKLWLEMEAKEVFPTEVSYTTLIDAYSKAGEEEKALHWFQVMKMKGLELNAVPRHMQNVLAAEETFQSFSLTLEACNALLIGYGIVGRVSDACTVFSEMVRAGIKPDTVTFNSMIKICAQAGKVEEAKAIYTRMIKSSDVFPDVLTFKTLIVMFIKEGNLPTSLEYFSKMKELGLNPDNETFNTLLNEFCLRSMLNEAEGMLTEMEELGIVTGKSVSLALAQMYERFGLLEKAALMLKKS